LGGGFGLSRSGSTISVGVFRGINLSESTRFSFLLGIPTIAAASIVEGRHLFQYDGIQHAAWFHSGASNPILLSTVGVCAAGVSGYFAVSLLERFTVKPRLGGFVIYCFIVGAAIILLGLSR
jgi:undecaprenyl-diphosphatase